MKKVLITTIVFIAFLSISCLSCESSKVIESDQTIIEQEDYIAQLEETIEELEDAVAELNNTISKQNNDIAVLEDTIVEQDDDIAELEQTISTYDYENLLWEMRQTPSTPVPSSFAGWGQKWWWNPFLGELGEWEAVPLTIEEMLSPYIVGSPEWAEQAANWWDVSRINRMLEEVGTPELMQYTSLVPPLVAQYFQDIEPDQWARDIESRMDTDPYGLTAMPSWGTISRWTESQQTQMRVAFENLHTGWTWEEVVRYAYETRPLG